MSTTRDQYQGPDKAAALDVAADYEEERFTVMQATSRCGAILRAWEKKGGNPDDIRDLYVLRKMSPEEQQAELRRQLRVASWLDIVSEDTIGQRSFLKAFSEPPAAAASGIGNAPLGSRLSLGRAKVSGYNDGRAKGSGTLQDGLAVWAETLGWEPDSPEALAYAGGFGEGLSLRPPPKASKRDQQAAAQAPDGAGDGTEGESTETPPASAKAAGKAGKANGRGKGTKAAALTQEVNETRPGWQGDRDFVGPTDDEPAALN